MLTRRSWTNLLMLIACQSIGCKPSPNQTGEAESTLASVSFGGDFKNQIGGSDWSILTLSTQEFTDSILTGGTLILPDRFHVRFERGSEVTIPRGRWNGIHLGLYTTKHEVFVSCAAARNVDATGSSVHLKFNICKGKRVPTRPFG